MDYKETILLPKTDFPMKGDLPKREPALLARWQQEDLYGQLRAARQGQKKFILHDGPPFANGDAHMGHALNKTLKDFVLKSRSMMGFDCPYIPGWDCHGLPIEHKVMKELKPEEQTPLHIREQSEAYARKYIALQKSQFQRLGVLADWEHPYLTLNASYEADILRVFADLVEQGLVYQGLRPVYWSTGCQTALAEAEIEYETKVDLALYVKFPLIDESIASLGLPSGTCLLLWTTTPWTLPANLAVAIADSLQYSVWAVAGQHLIVASSLGEKIFSSQQGHQLGPPLPGATLVGARYQHPFLDRQGEVYAGDFVTADAGTGLVHIAPGHGMDDYQLGQQHGLTPLSPVDDRGCLTVDCGVPELVGQYVFKANPLVIELLKSRGYYWYSEEYAHDYPHCWRSKTPIVFRSVKQWFIKVAAFRAEALAAINQVRWVPEWGSNRIKGGVASRADWCISRQRTWGVPIPVFYEPDTTPLLQSTVIRSVADLVEKKGSNYWFACETDDLATQLGLPLGLKKGTDTLDVWIDSGSSFRAVLQQRGEFPADLYLEGSDQHRGWFQSSLLLSVATQQQAPYRQVLTNGFVVDVDGKKLSKSAGAKGMMDYVNDFGADILRLWVASQDYTNDMPFSKEIFTRVADTYRQLRNTFRILLGNLHGFQASPQAVPLAELTEIDRYLAGRLNELIRSVRAAYEAYEFYQVYHLLNRFCALDLSAFYIDVLKDRLYCDAPSWSTRLSSQTMMERTLDVLLKLSAPLIPFTTEEAWQALGRETSIHLELFPEPLSFSAVDYERWEKLLLLRGLANEALEKARQEKIIGKSLEAALHISTDDFGPEESDLLKELCLVSSVMLVAGPAAVSVTRAQGIKCVRCWKYEETIGQDLAHPELCPRCTRAVSGAA
jgi:isoleucyl-tRNA synthetase